MENFRQPEEVLGVIRPVAVENMYPLSYVAPFLITKEQVEYSIELVRMMQAQGYASADLRVAMEATSHERFHLFIQLLLSPFNHSELGEGIATSAHENVWRKSIPVELDNFAAYYKSTYTQEMFTHPVDEKAIEDVFSNYTNAITEDLTQSFILERAKHPLLWDIVVKFLGRTYPEKQVKYILDCWRILAKPHKTTDEQLMVQDLMDVFGDIFYNYYEFRNELIIKFYYLQVLIDPYQEVVDAVSYFLNLILQHKGLSLSKDGTGLVFNAQVDKNNPDLKVKSWKLGNFSIPRNEMQMLENMTMADVGRMLHEYMKADSGDAVVDAETEKHKHALWIYTARAFRANLGWGLQQICDYLGAREDFEKDIIAEAIEDIIDVTLPFDEFVRQLNA